MKLATLAAVGTLTSLAPNVATAQAPEPRSVESPAMIGVGAMLTTVGLAGIVGGSVWIHETRTCTDLPCHDLQVVPAGIVVGLGALTFVPGVIAMVLGSQQAAPASAPPARRVSVRLGASSAHVDMGW